MSASNCPETPRQKMIQMMYLVYTAMLALNVSAEVISGFKTVGQAMDQSNKNVTVKIGDTFENFAAADKNNHDKVGPNYEKALEIKKMSDELTYYLDTTLYRFLSNIQGGKEAKVHVPDADTNKKAQELKIQIRDDNDLVLFDSIARAIDLGGFSWIDKLDDTHEATNFFLGHNPEGKTANDSTNAGIMKKKFIEYKRKIKELLGPDSMKVDLGLRVEPHEKYINPDGVAMTWEMLNFRETVAGAALVTLVRMKAEVLNAEYEAVNMLYKQISANDFSFDKVAVLCRPNSSYLMQGQKYELNVYVGAYDSKNHFRANIGGQTFNSNDTGAVVYTTATTTTGQKTITGTVYVTKDGGTEEYPFSQQYYVAAPMAVYELTEMNVVYRGIDNPIKISVPGTPAHDVHPEMDPSVATFSPAKRTVITENGKQKTTYVADKVGDGGFYIIHPKKESKARELVVSTYIGEKGRKDQNMGSYTFRIRTIPDPKVKIGSYESGKPISLSELRNMNRVQLTYGEDFAFRLPLPKVISQEVSITKVADDIQNKGAQWQADVLAAIAKARPGCKLSITLQVSMPDGSTRTLSASWRISR